MQGGITSATEDGLTWALGAEAMVPELAGTWEVQIVQPASKKTLYRFDLNLMPSCHLFNDSFKASDKSDRKNPFMRGDTNSN